MTMKIRGVRYARVRVGGKLLNDISVYTTIGGMMLQVLRMLHANWEERGW